MTDRAKESPCGPTAGRLKSVAVHNSVLAFLRPVNPLSTPCSAIGIADTARYPCRRRRTFENSRNQGFFFPIWLSFAGRGQPRRRPPAAGQILIFFPFRLPVRVYWESIRNGQVTIVAAPTVFPHDQWVHVAAAVDGNGTRTIYINGALVAIGTLNFPASVLRTQQDVGVKNLMRITRFLMGAFWGRE